MKGNAMEKLTKLSSAISNTVGDILIKKLAVDVYPDGVDKNHAIKDYEYAKHQLLCLIGEYDDEYQQYLNRVKNSKQEEEFPPVYNSHELIERCISEFYLPF